MAGISEYITKVTKEQMKGLLSQYQNNMQQKGNPGYYYGKLNEDGTKATLVDGTTVDIVTKGLPGTYAPVYMIGAGKGLVDQEEPLWEGIDGNQEKLWVFVSVFLPTPLRSYICLLNLKTFDSFIIPASLITPSEVSALVTPDGLGFMLGLTDYSYNISQFSIRRNETTKGIDLFFGISLSPALPYPREYKFIWYIIRNVTLSTSLSYNIEEVTFYGINYTEVLTSEAVYQEEQEIGPLGTLVERRVVGLDYYMDFIADENDYYVGLNFFSYSWDAIHNLTVVNDNIPNCIGPGICGPVNIIPKTFIVTNLIEASNLHTVLWKNSQQESNNISLWGQRNIVQSLESVPISVGCPPGSNCPGNFWRKNEDVSFIIPYAPDNLPEERRYEFIFMSSFSWSTSFAMFPQVQGAFRIYYEYGGNPRHITIWSSGNIFEGPEVLNQYQREYIPGLSIPPPNIEYNVSDAQISRVDLHTPQYTINQISLSPTWPLPLLGSLEPNYGILALQMVDNNTVEAFHDFSIDNAERLFEFNYTKWALEGTGNGILSGSSVLSSIQDEKSFRFNIPEPVSFLTDPSFGQINYTIGDFIFFILSFSSFSTTNEINNSRRMLYLK